MKWTMKVLAFALLSLGSAVADMAGECYLAGFYLELGCTPVLSADNSTCPDAFTCPDLHPDTSMCYYRGVPYADRSTVPQNLILNPCSVSCTCLASGGEPTFSCAAMDCFESFNTDVKEECVETYSLDSCCSVSSVCGKDAIAELKTCEVDGKTYYEGQTFEPKNTRKTCICTADWSGQVDNSSQCRDLNCGLEVNYQYDILNSCAPVFFDNKGGCPIAFECPTSKTKITRGLNIRNINSQCTFGNLTLTVGDEVSASMKCVTCSCQVPPFVSCGMKSSCDQ